MSEDIRTQFTGIISNIIEISEKACKLTSKDIDSIVTTSTRKKNQLLKKLYSLEEDINKMKMSITKMSFLHDSQKEVKEKKKEITEKEVNEKKNEVKEKEVKEKEVTEKEVTEKEVKEKEVKEKKKEKKKEEKKKEKKEEKEEEKNKKEEPIVDDPLHVKRKKIPKQIKTLVWNEYIGNDIMSNKCLCCKKEKIDIRNFHCGHVIAESKGGDLTIKNLRPICAPCNTSMGTMSMDDFTLTYFGYTV